MININFNKTKSSVIHAGTQSGMETGESSVITNLKSTFANVQFDLQPGIIIKMITNLVLILCFPLGLKVYEVREINKLEVQKQAVSSALKQTQDRLAQLKAELDSYSHLQEKSKEFATKKEFLRGLAEARLIIPRTVDLIQNKTPKTVWLERLNLKLSKEETAVEISGKSFNEAHVNSFAGSLHDILDKNSITVDTRDIKEGGSIVKVNFNLKGVIGGLL